MKHLFAATVITLSTAFTAASAIEQCDARFNTIYKEIQIFNRTEKIDASAAIVGKNLQAQINAIRGDLSLKEKIQSLETGFAKCDVSLSAEDDLEIKMTEEALLKMKNPLITD